MGNRKLIMLAVIAATLSVPALYGYMRFNAEAEGPPQPKKLASLEGFKPGARVTYKVLSPGEQPVAGEQVVGDDGKIDVPPLSMCQDTDSSLTYDFSIDEQDGDDPVTLTFNLDTGSGEVSMSGDGLAEYGPVSFKDDATEIDGKADWAGIFRHKGMWNLDQKKENNFEFAFFGNDVGGDIPLNPHIIKIFTAPGGGTFGPAGVNAYTNLWCETLRSGRVVPSTCDPESMGQYLLPAPNGGACPTNHMRIAAYNIMQNYIRALKMMTHEFTAIMIKQVQIIGTFVDAKHQLETQRDLELLEAQAHKDYSPSDTMCRFGSFMKGVPNTEQKIAFNKNAINEELMGAYTNLYNTSAAIGYDSDVEARILQFKREYCDPQDNDDGLAYLCELDGDQNLANSTQGAPLPTGPGGGGGIGAPDVSYDPPPPGPVNGGARMISNPRKNKDIDYARTADYPYTLNVDFTNNVLTNDEEDVLALARNLYWPRPLTPAEAEPLKSFQQRYMDQRHIVAMQNIAHNSFAEIVAMKANSDRLLDTSRANPDVSGWNFMKSMMREYGMSDEEIDSLLGEYPSYYAQMEVLTKKMYQNPDFFTNLYDKPVNLERISATMDTIRIMQQRDQFESKLRQEMLTSMLLEDALSATQEGADSALSSVKP